MGFSTGLYTSISGLRNSQTALAITSQNVSNAGVSGYTRQQLIQKSGSYLPIGSSGNGNSQQVGLGSNATHVRQIRDKFFDTSYREQNSIGNYYSTKYVAGKEIENILGELESSYNLQNVLSNVYQSINDLLSDPTAIETRTSFIEMCVTFFDKVTSINNSLYEYQMNLNDQVISQVNSINSIVSQINDLNNQINSIETDGSTRANNLRDQRNNLLDELSTYVDTEIKETPVSNGNSTRIDILVNGYPLLTNGSQMTLGVQYMNGDYPFVQPVFTTSKETLPVDADVKKLYPNLTSEDLSYLSSATSGSLKGLLISRGDCIGNYTMSDNEVGNYLITNLQKDLDTLVHGVVTLINETVAPTNGATQPYNLKGEQVATPIFIRKGEKDITVKEDKNNPATLFTTNNLEINPELLKGDGYNLLALSSSKGESDTTLIEKLIKDWKSSSANLEGYSVDGYYQKIITDLAIEINAAKENYEAQTTMVSSLDNKRTSISAVSLDEELSDMLKFQYAYNAAAKIVSTIDEMIQSVVAM